MFRNFPLLVFCLLIGCTSSQPKDQAPTPAATGADQIRPLKPGDLVPDVLLRRPDGTAVQTRALFSSRPTTLVLYRGGWCPYCTRHLQDLAKIEPQLLELGYQIVAVSPDRPQVLAQAHGKNQMNYALLSDHDTQLIRSMGLAFRVDDSMYTRLKKMGIDLEHASGQAHHVLPVPAVYLIDRQGKIQYAYWNPDYKTRLSGEALLEAARKAAAG